MKHTTPDTLRSNIFFINKCCFRIDKYEDIILPGSNAATTAKCRKKLAKKKTHKKCDCERIN